MPRLLTNASVCCDCRASETGRTRQLCYAAIRGVSVRLHQPDDDDPIVPSCRVDCDLLCSFELRRAADPHLMRPGAASAHPRGERRRRVLVHRARARRANASSPKGRDGQRTHRPRIGPARHHRIGPDRHSRFGRRYRRRETWTTTLVRTQVVGRGESRDGAIAARDQYLPLLSSAHPKKTSPRRAMVAAHYRLIVRLRCGG